MHSSPSPDPSPHLSSSLLPSQMSRRAGARSIQFWQVARFTFGLAVVIGVVSAAFPQPTQGLLGKLGRVLSMLFAAVCCLAMTRHVAGRERIAWGCITEAMGGSSWVESTGESGEGSTFHVRLPLPPSAPIVPPPWQPPKHPRKKLVFSRWRCASPAATFYQRLRRPRPNTTVSSHQIKAMTIIIHNR